MYMLRYTNWEAVTHFHTRLQSAMTFCQHKRTLCEGDGPAGGAPWAQKPLNLFRPRFTLRREWGHMFRHSGISGLPQHSLPWSDEMCAETSEDWRRTREGLRVGSVLCSWIGRLSPRWQLILHKDAEETDPLQAEPLDGRRPQPPTATCTESLGRFLSACTKINQNCHRPKRKT